MNTWNTFRDESFTYPNLCAQCAAAEPAETFELKYSEIEFPEGMPGGPFDQKPRNYNTFITSVPVCTACLAATRKRIRICWLLGAVAGAASASFLLGYLQGQSLQGQAAISPRGCVSTSVAAGVLATLIAGFLFKLICSQFRAFAKYDGRAQKLQFRNKEFQEQYDRLNFNYSPTTGRYASGARAW